MTDLITVVGDAIDHLGGLPLKNHFIRADPSNAITRTVDGKIAATDGHVDIEDDGTFSLDLVWAPGLRYRIILVRKISKNRLNERTLGTLDCNSHTPGSTVDVSSLPPVVGPPRSAYEELQAWILAQLAAGVDQATLEAAIEAYLTENPPGIPGHGVTGLWAGSQEAYDEIPTLSPTTLYFITA